MGSPEKTIDVELGHGDVSVKGLGDKVEEAHDEAVPLKSQFEIEEESRFTGLKRNELMELANQPQWRRARWFLFIIFWVVWVGMLAAAVLIVYNAPKCKALPETEWYQNTVLYKVSPGQYTPEQNYQGMLKHMKYVKNLRTSLLLSDVMGEDMGAPKGDSASFDQLVVKAHEYNVKVVVELKVDSLPITSDAFNRSSAEACDSSSTEICSLFQWKDASETGFTEFSGTARSDAYYFGDVNRARLNYAGDYAYQYLADSLAVWLERDVDGFLIRDLSQVSTSDERKRVVSTAWEKLSTSGTEEKQLALFVVDGEMSSSKELSAVYSKGQNETVGTPAPIVMYDTFSSGTSNDAATLQNVLEESRNNSRSFHGLMMNADVGDNVNKSLALTVVNLALPGVPLLKAGEELGNVEKFSTFTWADEDSKTPVHAGTEPSKSALKLVGDLVKKRIADTLSKPSLRYDTRDEDTSFFFSDTGNKDVVCFCRKWASKPAILVVSNMNEKEQTFTLDYKNCSESLAKSEVLLSTAQEGKLSKGSNVEADKFTKLPGYTTVILTG